MENLITKTEDGKLVVSSRRVAKDFGKEHKNVVRAIENLTAQNSAVKNIMIKSTFNHRGNEYKEYLLTRDGFSLLVMGFNGREALEWKLKYIEAFNTMERKLKEISKPDSYMIDDPIERAKRWIEEREQYNKVAAELEEQNSFVNKISESNGSMLVREVAKLASKGNITIGEKALWNKLREWGYI